ncbi:FERM and PDZ domain-containing protein 3 isoform X2 [Pseudophryne corroboree]|uniref:FERM and PDZ domain-containing protein 3 isoform X2 n=1 Tax=Pseudophryne corroboree TaxID=495146 RepID=UPI00308147EC
MQYIGRHIPYDLEVKSYADIFPTSTPKLFSKKNRQSLSPALSSHEMRKGAMECGQLTPQSVRQVIVLRHPGVGFGFVAGSARPVVVRSVISGGPSENKLLSGDQILAINDEDVSDASRERFIELVRNAKESITLTVLHPHQDMLKIKDSPPLLLIPNVLKVFLENGQIKSFTFDGRTTVKDVMVTLQDRLSLRHRDHFSLILEYSASDQNQKFLLLQDKQPLAHVVHRTHYQGMRCLFRVCFFPKDPADILHLDPAAFEYLYIQSRNDVIRERLGAELKPEMVLGLSALHIYISVSSSRPGQKISLRGVEKEWGLEPFLPPSLLQVYKEKSLRKALAQHLKIHQNQLSGNKVSIIQAKLRYLRILNELPTFAGVLFNTVAMGEKTPATTLLVGPRHGISHVIDLKTNLTTVLFEFSQVTKVQLFRESQGVARVETSVTDTKSLVLLMDWPEATSFACLIAGYYRLLVDPKKGIFYRAAGHLPPPQIIKAEPMQIGVFRSSAEEKQRRRSLGLCLYCGEKGHNAHSCSRKLGNDKGLDHISLPTVPRMPASVKAVSSSSISSAFSHSKGPVSAIHTPSENKEPISLCYLNLQDKEGRDVNQNHVTKETRPRTKSDPTPKGSSNQHGMEGPKDPPEVCRSRSFTMDTQVKLERTNFFCDSCKAKMKSQLEGGGADVKCINSCGSSTCRDNMVDLISLPPPEHVKGKKEEDEYEGEIGTNEREVGETTTLLPSAAPPPPGFGDNSSDEEEPKRIDLKGREQGKVRMVSICGYEELPVTLIDSVQTRTVKDHARDLDDALVSTLQALEALAASEEYPSPTSQPTTGLIVLAAITPEPSLDSGHETNSSELTDVSQMVTAMKQHHNTAYFLAHHLNKESLLSRKELPFRIQTCAAQAVITSPYSLGHMETSPVLKPAFLQQNLIGAGLQQVSTDASLNPLFHLNNGMSRLKSPEKSKAEPCFTTPVITSKISTSPPKKRSCPNLASTVESSENILSSSTEKSISKSTKTQSDKDSEEEKISPDSPCDCQLSQGDSSPATLVENRHDGDNVLNLSPTDDERLHAKACSARSMEEQRESHKIEENKEIDKTCVDYLDSPNLIKRNKESNENSEQPDKMPSVPNSHVITRNNAKLTIKSDTDITSQVSEKVPTPIKLDDCDAPAKPRARATFKLRKLFSATFPTRMRRETDERQAQLRKVKQYEMEFLEELLKPRGKLGAQHQELLCPLVPGRCSCQVRSSPVQKVPGMSREQRRSCDCKRITRGICVQPNPTLESEQRNRTLVHNTSHIGIRLVRSSSLESRDTEKRTSCLTTCAAHDKSTLQYTKLPQKYNVSEEENKDLPYNPPPTKSQKKESEAILQKNKTQDISGIKDERKTPLILPRQEDVFSVQTKLPEEEIVLGEKCCSFRHCFNCRRCSSGDDNSDRDELSYSIPMQILPGMRINPEATPILSQTLQVLDATVCSGPEDNQTQEIDLRTATFEGSLAKVNALRGRSYSLPDGFISVQLDTNELLTVLRQCLVSTEAGEPKLAAVHLSQRKQELTLHFKEFRASCRRMAGVDKNPEHMLTAVTCSFKVLCGLIETFVKLVFVIRSESQRQELLCKVEEVVRNYTFLLRAAEESSARTSGQSRTVVGHLAKQSATVATAVSTFSRSIKTLMSK